MMELVKNIRGQFVLGWTVYPVRRKMCPTQFPPTPASVADPFCEVPAEKGLVYSVYSALCPVTEIRCNQSIHPKRVNVIKINMAVIVNDNVIKEVRASESRYSHKEEQCALRSCNAVSRWKMQPQQCTIFNELVTSHVFYTHKIFFGGRLIKARVGYARHA